MKLKAFWHREEGATAILAAVAFVMILVLCGLVIDLGMDYYQGGVLQNAADAAAYAAASTLPLAENNATGIKQVKNLAISYCVKNGVEASRVNSVRLGDVVNGHFTSVRVQVSRDVNYFFGPIVGIDSTTVTKSAKVRVEGVKSLSSMVPLGIDSAQFEQALQANGSKNVVVKYGAGDSQTGFFGAIDLDGVQGGGAKDFSSWLANGYQGFISIGETLPVESGNMAGPTETAFTARYNQCTHYPSQGGCNSNKFVPTCPRVVSLIIYSMVDAKNLQVVGFAPFILEDIDSKGVIRASHVTVQVQSGDTAPLDDQSFSYGVMRSRLVA